MKVDLVIIGAGPAGMSAAITAEKAGASVILIDESFSLGGQLKQDIQWYTNLPEKYASQRGTSLGEQLTRQLLESNVILLTKHTMIGSYLNGNIAVTDGVYTFEIEAENIILATGAQEEAKVFPGWTLPGVMTAGAAQLLMNRERVLPGKRAIMLGYNAYSIETAKQLRACGASILAFVDDADPLISADQELDEMHDVPVYLNSTIESVTGRGEVEKVMIRTPNQSLEIQVDLICISSGFSPIIEPFEILGCDIIYSKDLGGFVPEYNTDLETSHPSCYVAGNAAGITSLGPTILTGEIAAISALVSLKLVDKEEADRAKRVLWDELLHLERVSDGNRLDARISLMRNFNEKHGGKSSQILLSH